MRISLVFEKIILAIFGQGYQRWKCLSFLTIFGQGYQRSNFLFFNLFGKDTNGDSFGWSWSFLAKDTNSESFCFSWSFLVKVTNGESFCFAWTFLAKVTFIGHFSYEYQWWRLCLWFEILINLWHPSLPNANSRSLEAISGTSLCNQEFELREATAGMGLQVREYLYAGRQTLARKYEYLVPRNATC